MKSKVTDLFTGNNHNVTGLPISKLEDKPITYHQIDPKAELMMNSAIKSDQAKPKIKIVSSEMVSPPKIKIVASSGDDNIWNSKENSLGVATFKDPTSILGGRQNGSALRTKNPSSNIPSITPLFEKEPFNSPQKDSREKLQTKKYYADTFKPNDKSSETDKQLYKLLLELATFEDGSINMRKSRGILAEKYPKKDKNGNTKHIGSSAKSDVEIDHQQIARIRKSSLLMIVRPDLFLQINIVATLKEVKGSTLEKIKNITFGSHMKVVWDCLYANCNHHQWISVICNRSRSACPYCPSGGKVCLCNSLETKYPLLMKQWDYQKNKGVDPGKTPPVSNTKVWWKCDNPDVKCDHHRWEVSPGARTNTKSGCPFCASGGKVCDCNSLQTKYPLLMKQWDKDKNKGIDPNRLSRGSGMKVWWKCDNPDVKCDHHRWEAIIADRIIAGHGCPFCSPGGKVCDCNSLQMKYPVLMKQWDHQKNGDIDPSMLSCGSHEKVWWKCDNPDVKCNHHRWETEIRIRVNGSGCPFCCTSLMRKVCECDSIYTKFPDLMKEWDHDNNQGIDVKQLSKGSSTSVYWKCQKGHSWTAKVYSRVGGRGCPFCRLGKSERLCRVIFEDILKVDFPKKRPPFLNGLELDGYNEKLQLAFEYNGRQHLEYIPHFHFNNPENLVKQKERDKLKRELCKANGIVLILISHEYNFQNKSMMRDYIISKINELKIIG